MNYAKLQNVFCRIMDERKRQDQLKEQGRFRFTCADTELGEIGKGLILGEEYGEVCRAVLSHELLSYDSPEKGTREHLRKELTQVAAVACAWLESMELEPVEGIQL